jgi:hypothetical protein
MYFKIHIFFPLQKGHSNLENLPFQISHPCLAILTSRSNIQIIWHNYILLEKLLTLRISKYYGRIHYLGKIAEIFHTKLEHWCLFIFNLEGWKESGTSTYIWQKDRKCFQCTEHSRETTKSKKITQNTIRERTGKRNAKWKLSKVKKDEKNKLLHCNGR